jgi:hypothetical protein
VRPIGGTASTSDGADVRQRKVKTFVYGLVHSHLAVTTNALCPLFIGYGGDSVQNLARFWTSHRDSVMAVQSLLAEIKIDQAFVADGAALTNLQQDSTNRCPMCHVESNALHQLAPFEYPVPRVPHVVVGGVVFVDIFSHPRSVWRGLKFSPLKVIWGIGHCAAQVVTQLLSRGIQYLDRNHPGTSLPWVAALHAVVPTFRGSGCELSWDETKMMLDGGLPSPGIVPKLDELCADVRVLLGLIRRPSEESERGVNPALAFGAVAARFRAGWVSFFGPMVPKVHYLVDHFPIAWVMAQDNTFPLRVSEEAGEKSHIAAASSWIKSLMTVVAARTGEDGMVEVMRATLLRFFLTYLGCGEPPKGTVAAAVAQATVIDYADK